MGGSEMIFIRDAFASNYIAPVGPQVDAFEKEFAEAVGAKHAAAVSEGTTALHLLLRYVGVGPGDEVFCSTFTFVASANPIQYCGGRPVFIDSDLTNWNMDPGLLAGELKKRAANGRLLKGLERNNYNIMHLMLSAYCRRLTRAIFGRASISKSST
jgi:pyridoxal phosphate-dependent aminotransferase EpsN